MEVLHERPHRYVAEDGPFAADGFGDEGTASVGSLERGRMKLDHLHVAYFGSRAIGHRNAVAGSDVGISRELVDLSGTTGSQNHGIGRKRLDATSLGIEHVESEDAIIGGADRARSEFGAGDEVDGEVVLEHHHLR